ncbi:MULTISPECIES: queuosine precursor transporter [unclassified Haladaptatus]|uniref:queuosine precursor transporter n=1 Tax=unclassified Haladaptatus TaxID=2622732 RepID=UPI0023E7939C|nr:MULTISPECIES: queuosine precursor transporter [unclassified Haladaptatus]
MTSDAGDPVRLALVALFITALVTAQLTASKVLAFSIPFSLPLAGNTLILPGAALAYALTFFASDCYAELYGRKPATMLVNVGFGMTLVMLVLVWTTIQAPAFQFSPVDATTFASVLGASTNIVIGSLAAYVVSQNWDVFAFHKIREFTNGEHLWLRNIGSTASSQVIDTVIFVSLAFYLVPQLLGTGNPLPLVQVAGLIIGQYLLKLLIALGDTPFVYAVVGFVTSRREKQVADAGEFAFE